LTLVRTVTEITEIVLRAGEKARQETGGEAEPEFTRPSGWPRNCTVGPGLEGAIACDSEVGYVNGSKGWLIYRGYDIFELAAYSSFEETSALLLRGTLPSRRELDELRESLRSFLPATESLRQLMTFPIESMNSMAALRLGVDLMRQAHSHRDEELFRPDPTTAIGSDEDSIAMETPPMGEERAVYEFQPGANVLGQDRNTVERTCVRLIAGLATLTCAIGRLRERRLPIEPDPELTHAGNLLYMLRGRRPSSVEERIMDIALILHADHGMNASTFASLVVASTLSDVYFSIGSGIAALNGPLHGGANEQVVKTLQEIGLPSNVGAWLDEVQRQHKRVMGFGHRVYKAYDPRARILGPLAGYLAEENEEVRGLYLTARELERQVIERLAARKGVFPNVDFYSGLIYKALGIPLELFTPIFAVSRVAGWSARIIEYLQNNRIFRPRAIYVGPFDRRYVAIGARA
jgi:citrate synthase